MIRKKKKNKLFTNTNAGNIEYNIAFFNMMNGAKSISGIGQADGTVGNVSAGGGMGESIESESTERYIELADQCDDIIVELKNGEFVCGFIKDGRFVDEVGDEINNEEIKKYFTK